MAWPIILRRALSDAVLSATREFLKTLDGEARAMYAVLLHQMERGITLGREEQAMLQHALAHQLDLDPNPDLETAYFRLYGVWRVRPTWWERKRM